MIRGIAVIAPILYFRAASLTAELDDGAAAVGRAVIAASLPATGTVLTEVWARESMSRFRRFKSPRNSDATW